MSETSVIWKFRINGSYVRLLLEAPDEKLAALHAELQEIGESAPSLSSFVRDATNSIHAAHGMLGEILKGPWPEMSFKDKVRAAMHLSSVEAAAAAVLSAASEASKSDWELLRFSPDWNIEREYLFNVWSDLDESGPRFLLDLAEALDAEVSAVSYSLGILDL